MKLFLVILIGAAFIQTVLLPINLVLVLLICRSLIVEDRSNLWAAFLVGLLLGLLSSVNIGFWALTLLLAVKLATLLKRLPVALNLKTSLPIALVIIILANLLEGWFLKTSWSYLKFIAEAVLVIPVYLAVKIWEERFVVAKEMKLKLNS